MENKYGGINDCPTVEKRIYNLWYQMLRRCYDKEQQNRDRGRSYAGCSVSNRWMRLSNFANDVKKLDGYSDWRDKTGYCLDKDVKLPGNKVYCREYCSFIPYTENIRDISRRHKDITRKANESNKVVYVLRKGDETLVFPSEKDACKYLGVVKCTVSSCFRRGCKCKGYSVSRQGARMKGVSDDA